jgi:macrolide transport system ATP-binding/permease protein
MSPRSRMSSLWRNLAHRRRVERDLDEEIRAAFDLCVEERMKAGMTPDGARRAASLEFGRVEAVKDGVRDVRAGAIVDALRQDVRQALRTLTKSPGFTAVAALSVALGIGANGALFSLHDAIMLRPLPVRDSDAIVTVSASNRDDEIAGAGMAYANFRDLRERSRSFDGMVATALQSVSFARERQGVREMRIAMLVSDGFFDVLGVQAARGRRFVADEGRVPGRDAVVVLGYDFWHNVLGDDPSILNAAVVINGVDFIVVGIMPERFTGLHQFIRPAFYLPLTMAARLGVGADDWRDSRSARRFTVKARLRRGVTRTAAQAEVSAIWKELERQYPNDNGNRTVAVRTELQERIHGDQGNAIIIAIMTVLGMIVLAIACANVANLLLGRARARAREVAVRLVLGISRLRLLRQLLVESLLLALAGSVVGVALAYGGTRFLAYSAQTITPTALPIVIDPQLDMRMLLFTLAATVASAFLFGIAPAWQSLKTDLVPALKSAEPGLAVRHRTIGRNVLVVAQVALSMILLVATAIMLDGVRRTFSANPGFRKDHLVMLSTDTSLQRYTPTQTHEFYRALVEQAGALPGVASVALASGIPFGDIAGYFPEMVIPDGYQFPKGQESAQVPAAIVDEHYFATAQTRMLGGRDFTAADRSDSRAVAIVNEQFAKVYWPGQNPVGKRMRLAGKEGAVEIVGLTETGQYFSVGEAPLPFVYFPFAQRERAQMTLLVETTSRDATPLAAPLRELVRRIDVNQPVYAVQTAAAHYERRAIAPRLMVSRTAGAMGVMGLTLALVGLYGLVTYSVARRTRELGIRLAIGASRWNVVKMVLRQGMRLSMAGILLGSAASVIVVRVLTSAVVGGSGNPPLMVYAAVALLLIGLTLTASYVPARRASRVDPLSALRSE